jgi:molybdopterin/thiamine biosynthesis adenylyltransferase
MSKACPDILSRQELVPGFKQEALENAAVALIGGGGLGGEIGIGLVRKGVKNLTIYDEDIVEPSNLPRQHFYPEDLWENKACALVKNLRREAINPTSLAGIPYTFQNARKLGLVKDFSVAICGVDNNPARISVSRHFYHKKVPVIFTAVSADADHGYVFIQEPGGPCFACLFPDTHQDARIPCAPTPAVKDILKIASGLVLYAVDTVLMPRKRGWNYRELFLAFGDERKCKIERRSGCPLCWKAEFVEVKDE